MSQDPDPTDLRGQERVRRDKTERSRLDEQDEVSDIRWLMGNKRGRRILWRLLEQAGVFHLSFNTNAMQMAFAEGNRNFGNKTLAVIHTHCADQFLNMLKEHWNGRSRNVADDA